MTIETVADLMTADPLSLLRSASLKDAHDLMREKNIRHIPVIDEQGQLVGMLTQKVMMAAVIGLLAKYGATALERKEKQQLVADLMLTDFATVTADQNLREVATFFVKNRHGCLPVITPENKLVGILTSSDFVRLAVELLA
ncbi:CBS domain-containing protein [Alishewanella longhuensis]|uniref:CBS domain-containing protein n=1 Tax=Alishewanella longhuensis TaxID=1091037 RepID=A0ABQ3KWJ1_9ALTE|nr:CBS domain-containing protein [Alishewanella longhuensis]GHG63788.1 CBS domain-containing protein [Alishewanella longhuensis]